MTWIQGFFTLRMLRRPADRFFGREPREGLCRPTKCFGCSGSHP